MKLTDSFMVYVRIILDRKGEFSYKGYVFRDLTFVTKGGKKYVLD